MSLKGASKLFLCLVALSFAVVLCARRLDAQVLYGTVVGTVTDQSGAVVPDAVVTLTNPKTSLKREARTDSAGLYSIPNLPEGVYDLTVSVTGFKELRRTGIGVNVGTVGRQDAQLEIGAQTQEVTVQASAAQLQTEKSDTSTKLSTVPVSNLPTGFYRNFQMLMALAPGAGVPCEGCTGSLVDTPERAVSIAMNGLPYGGNTTRLDGALSTFQWKPEGGTLYVPPVESIQEVNITTSNYDPEKGMAGAAATDVVTKSGTNDLHGVAFWYHFNQHFLSCEPFDAACKSKAFGGSPQNKPKQILNDTGGNLGGPIKKDKLFFFANWDGVFQRNNFSRFLTVPSAAIKGGDFSESLVAGNIVDANGNPIMVPTVVDVQADGTRVLGGNVPLQQGMIFDPLTGNTSDGTGRAVFAYQNALNVMPPNAMYSGVVNFLADAPDANVPGTVDPDWSGVTRNFFMSENQKFRRHNFDGKIDWNRNEKHLIWGKYSAMDALTSAVCGFNAKVGGVCGESWGDSGKHHDLVQVVTLGHTWSLSPNLVIDGSLGYSRMGIDGYPDDFGNNVGLDVLKIPGTNDPSDPRYGGIPQIMIGGFGDPYWSGNAILFGSPTTWNPYYRNDWSLTNSHNVAWTKGKHTIRFGTDIIHHHLNHWQPENGFGPRGGFTFYYSDTTFLNTTNLNIPSDGDIFHNRYNGFAAFLMGMFDSGGKAIQYQKMNAKENEFGFHFLDRWRVMPKLTLNLGIRYEYYPLMRRDSLGKGLERYDPDTNMMLLGGLGDVPRNIGASTSKKYFAPRVGVAYEINPNTVVRAGYGITFDPYPITRELRGTYPSVISSSEVAPGGNSFLPGGTFAQGIANLCCPDVSQGRIPIPGDVEARFIGPEELKRGIIQSWNVTVERKLPASFLLGLGYVGNRTSDLWSGIDLQATTLCDPTSGVTAGGDSYDAVCHLKPLEEKWGRTAGTGQLQGYVSSHYNSLQLTLDRHFEKGLYVKFAYTYSKAIDMQGLWGAWDAPMFGGPGYLQHNRGMGDEDRRHVMRMAYVWELPFGANRKFANSNRVVRAVVGGWQLNGIVSKYSGIPHTLTADNNLNANGNEQTVDQVAAIHKTGGLGPGTTYYDQSSFVLPPASDLLLPDGSVVRGQARFGSTGRNIAVYGPGHVNLDASLFRHFKLSERFDLQFRAESLNFTNTPDWGNGDDFDHSCAQTGTSQECGGSFLRVGQARGHRIFRFGLRLQF